MTKIMHSIPTHSIPRIFTSSAASTPPKVKASLDATVSYCGRSLTVRNTENFPQIGKVFKGSTSCVKEIFFPRTFNVETKLMQELVVDLINNFETVQFEFGYIATDVKVKYKGETYNFYDVMKKVKWDLISLDRLTLDRHLLNFKEYRYESSYYSVPGEVPSDKTYLYEKLHSAEKVAVNDYGTRGPYL